MAEDGTWGNQTLAHKGALIRFLFADPYRLTTPVDQILNFTTGIYAANGGAAKFGGNLNAGHHPTQAQMIGFKEKMLVNLREFVDSIGFTIKATVPDEELGRLAGAATLDGLDHERGIARFLQSQGTGSLAGDTRETGVDRGVFERSNTEDAILRPNVYIERANNDLRRIDELSLNVYRESFRKYYDEYKYDIAEAKKRAMSDKDNYYNMLKKQHDEVFKADLFKQAKKRIVKQV